jgi:hypothetical protein
MTPNTEKLEELLLKASQEITILQKQGYTVKAILPVLEGDNCTLEVFKTITILEPDSSNYSNIKKN